MVSPEAENCILYDWLTFTSKCDSPGTLISLLGLDGVTFEDRPRGRNGYRSMMAYEGISILYDGREDMGVCVDMSGSGCRVFETYSSSSWDDLFSVILGGDYNISRLDVAADDHTGLGQFVTRFFSGSVDTTAGTITSVSWTKDRDQALTFRDYDLFHSFCPEFRRAFPDVDTVFFEPDDTCRGPRLAAVLDETELRFLRRVLGSASSERYPEYEDSWFDAFYRLVDKAIGYRSIIDWEASHQ